MRALALLSILTAVPALGLEMLEIRGVVRDSSGAAVTGARIEAGSAGDRVRWTESGLAGDFQLRIDGDSRDASLSVSKSGFAVWRGKVPAAGAPELAITLEPAVLAQEIVVSSTSIAATPEAIAGVPGSVELLEPAALRDSRVFGFEEALRKLAGVYARGEEGFSLRPNIGIRGLNPTRSSRVLLLEDGVPLAYAPYGDNASYYHPPVDRFDSIEVIKGSGQIAYGPMTVGGVVNYVTPPIGDKPHGSVALTGGNRDYLNAHLRYGGTWRGVGLLLDGVRKQGEGSRANVRSGLNDLNAKALFAIGSRQAVILKGNYYSEDSRVTYSGLRLAEWQADPYQNPFRNDSFEGDRAGGSMTHSLSLTGSAILTSTVYGQIFSRDWWRQSSNSNQRPNDAADPQCRGMANLHTTCGNEGRLRHYSTWGIDPRLKVSHNLLGIRSELDAGVRAHFEEQERVQQNGATPLARTGVTVENNLRRNQAYSGYVQNRFFLGDFVITPGLRLENVQYQRTNRLFNSGAGASGNASLTQWIPGIGVAWTKSTRITIFGGIHRGFAPPRTEDIISNSGGFVDLEPETSWNTEIGARTRLGRHFSADATFFRLDYSNQIIPASLAGGVGAALTSAGKTLNQGFETSARYEMPQLPGTGGKLQFRGAWTWIPVARFEGTRYSNVPGNSTTLVTGNRLPYASGSLLNASVAWMHRTGVNTLVEMVQTSRQFGDDLNSINPSADGQRGALPGYVLWNATLNVPVEAWRTVLFITTKNLADRLVLVDRARGMLPGSPRLIQAGLRFSF